MALASASASASACAPTSASTAVRLHGWLPTSPVSPQSDARGPLLQALPMGKEKDKSSGTWGSSRVESPASSSLLSVRHYEVWSTPVYDELEDSQLVPVAYHPAPAPQPAPATAKCAAHLPLCRPGVEVMRAAAQDEVDLSQIVPIACALPPLVSTEEENVASLLTTTHFDTSASGSKSGVSGAQAQGSERASPHQSEGEGGEAQVGSSCGAGLQLSPSSPSSNHTASVLHDVGSTSTPSSHRHGSTCASICEAQGARPHCPGPLVFGSRAHGGPAAAGACCRQCYNQLTKTALHKATNKDHVMSKASKPQDGASAPHNPILMPGGKNAPRAPPRAESEDSFIFRAQAKPRLQPNQALPQPLRQDMKGLNKQALQRPLPPSSSSSSRNPPRGKNPKCGMLDAGDVSLATGEWCPANILGEGSFGKVFKGHISGQAVAVKRLDSEGTQGNKEYAREIQVLSAMKHPNIVRLLGHCPETHCLVFELAHGGSLWDWLAHPGKLRSLTWKSRVQIMLGIAYGLVALHEASPPIVHRDLKPGNILLDADLNVKLADFGLARLLESESSTCTYTVSGTAGYIDPEGIKTFEVSPQADIYAFGLIGMQLLLGQQNVSAVHNLLAQEGVMGGGWSQGRMQRVSAGIPLWMGLSPDPWPLGAAQGLCLLCLRCIQTRRALRPGLWNEIIPALQRLLKS